MEMTPVEIFMTLKKKIFQSSMCVHCWTLLADKSIKLVSV